jgi:hypothetical protein
VDKRRELLGNDLAYRCHWVAARSDQRKEKPTGCIPWVSGGKTTIKRWYCKPVRHYPAGLQFQLLVGSGSDRRKRVFPSKTRHLDIFPLTNRVHVPARASIQSFAKIRKLLVENATRRNVKIAVARVLVFEISRYLFEINYRQRFAAWQTAAQIPLSMRAAAENQGGSYPPVCQGWHRPMRQMPLAVPSSTPYFCTAPIK